jgi:hypothetical protein
LVGYFPVAACYPGAELIDSTKKEAVMQHETYRTHEQQEPEWIRYDRGPGRIASGMLILIGAIYLLGMSGVNLMGYSPWILMALVPGLWMGLLAFKGYRRAGRITVRVAALAGVSLIPFVFVAAALLGFNVGALWPLGLIGIGVSCLVFGGDRIRP